MFALFELKYYFVSENITYTLFLKYYYFITRFDMGDSFHANSAKIRQGSEGIMGYLNFRFFKLFERIYMGKVGSQECEVQGT